MKERKPQGERSWGLTQPLQLEARVRALVRRGMGATSNNIKHGPLT